MSWTEVYNNMVKETEPRSTQPLEVLSWPVRGMKGLILDPDVFRFGRIEEAKEFLADVGRRFRVVVAGNSSRGEIERELDGLGLADLVEKGAVAVMGAEDVGLNSLTPEFYGEVASRLGLSPRECLMVGGRLGVDGFSAIGAGMGSMIVNSADGLKRLLSNELGEGHVLEKKFDIERYLMDMYKPGEVTIIGVVGRNAAGKSATAERMVLAGQEMGLPTALLSIESFHIRSRKERAAWLAEVRNTDQEEYERRADQDNWFDMEGMQWALETLRSKQGLHMEGVYDMAQGGEKVGIVDIPIDPERGAIVVFEGKAVDELSELMSDVIYVTAHPNSRLERLFERDGLVRGPEELMDRLRFYTHWDLKHLLGQRDRVTRVLSNDGDDLVELPLMVPLL